MCAASVIYDMFGAMPDAWYNQERIDLFPQIETAFLPTNPVLSVVSSSMVKEIAKYGGDIKQFVPTSVAEALFEKLKSAPK